jgi:regulator of protease activity HflC (stomatin/prohibitin superfamily)
MKKILLASVALAALSVGGCAVVSPGHEGIKVNYYGTDKGVSDIPLVTGMVWYNPFTTSVFVFPTYVQTTQWVANEQMVFNSKEGMVFAADISLSYQIEASKVPAFYVKFRTDKMETFTDGFLHNIARDAFNEVASTYDADELYTKKDELIPKVLAKVNAQTKDFGVNLIQLGYIGALHAPENVTLAIQNKVAAIQNAQRAENEIQQAKAEAAKTVATAQGEADSRIARAKGEAEALVAEAQGKAKANQVLSATINPQLLQWKQIEVSAEYATRWNGEMPQIMGGQTPNLFMGFPPKAVTPSQ